MVDIWDLIEMIFFLPYRSSEINFQSLVPSVNRLYSDYNHSPYYCVGTNSSGDLLALELEPKLQLSQRSVSMRLEQTGVLT